MLVVLKRNVKDKIETNLQKLVAVAYFFSIYILTTIQIIASRNIMMQIALIVCITLRLKLVGLFGSFFLKKYMNKYRKA